MSVTVRHDIVVYQGMVLAVPFAMHDDTGAVQDYTGYTGTFAIYAAPATLDSLHDQPPILSLTDTSGAVNLGLFDGGDFGEYSAYLYLTQAQTSTLSPWGQGVYNLDIVDPMGHPQVRVRGTILLEEGKKHD